MDESPPKQNPTTPTTEQPVLILISHSHRRPLSCPPHLKFDLRKVSNPPKHIRDAYDGRSKRLREYMLHMEDFTSLLETAKKSIEVDMTMFVQNGQGESSAVMLGCLDAPSLQGRLTDHQSCAEAHGATPQVPEVKDDVSENPQGNAVQLVVSCFCERGRHRSVAFAEELSRYKRPREWAVEIHHRDVDEVHGKKQDHRKRNDAQRKMQRNDGFGGIDLE